MPNSGIDLHGFLDLTCAVTSITVPNVTILTGLTSRVPLAIATNCAANFIWAFHITK
jgi:hypothetical protein